MDTLTSHKMNPTLPQASSLTTSKSLEIDSKLSFEDDDEVCTKILLFLKEKKNKSNSGLFIIHSQNLIINVETEEEEI